MLFPYLLTWLSRHRICFYSGWLLSTPRPLQRVVRHVSLHSTTSREPFVCNRCCVSTLFPGEGLAVEVNLSTEHSLKKFRLFCYWYFTLVSSFDHPLDCMRDLEQLRARMCVFWWWPGNLDNFNSLTLRPTFACRV